MGAAPSASGRRGEPDPALERQNVLEPGQLAPDAAVPAEGEGAEEAWRPTGRHIPSHHARRLSPTR